MPWHLFTQNESAVQRSKEQCNVIFCYITIYGIWHIVDIAAYYFDKQFPIRRNQAWIKLTSLTQKRIILKHTVSNWSHSKCSWKLCLQRTQLREWEMKHKYLSSVSPSLKVVGNFTQRRNADLVMVQNWYLPFRWGRCSATFPSPDLHRCVPPACGPILWGGGEGMLGV